MKEENREKNKEYHNSVTVTIRTLVEHIVLYCSLIASCACFLPFCVSVFGNNLELFPIFLFSPVLVFTNFCFQNNCQTVSDVTETCFGVLKTENLFSKQVPNRKCFVNVFLISK